MNLEITEKELFQIKMIEDLKTRMSQRDSIWLSKDDTHFLADYPTLTKSDLKLLKASILNDKTGANDKKLPSVLANDIQIKYKFDYKRYREYEEEIKSELFNSGYSHEKYMQVINEYDLQIKRHNEQYKQKLCNDVKYDSSMLPYFVKWCNAYGIVDEIDQYIFSHALWLIKRNLFDLETSDEIFINYYSPQGGMGKSKNLSTLAKALCNSTMLVEDPDFSKIANTEKYGHLLRRYIWIFQDITQVDKADKNAVKSIITSPNFEMRTYFTQDNETYKRNVTFFATSNYALKLGDDKTARRFWNTRINRQNWDVLNQMEADGELINVWKSIDENHNQSYIRRNKTTFDEILKTQESELRSENLYEQFIYDCEVKYVKGGSISSTLIYDNYRKFLKSRNYRGIHPSNRTCALGLIQEYTRIYGTTPIKHTVNGNVWEVSLDASLMGGV